MKFEKFDNKYEHQAYELFADFRNEENFYKELTEEEFINFLFKNNAYQAECTFMCTEGEKLLGFASGLVRECDKENPNSSGYVHTIIVKKEYRRQGIGSKLLELCENYFKEMGKPSSRVVFLGQINYPWYIPHTDKHIHPGCPGVRINSEYYLFLYHHKYVVNSIHEGFHCNLATYDLPEKVKNKMAENEKIGIKIELYDPAIHTGVEEFCQAIGNDGFANSIRYNLQREKPYPFVIAADHGKMMAWTGAVYTEPNGRGHLDGVCVHPDARKLGLGTGIFAKLCLESKKNNAKYMTLFTGIDNPARYIYLGAGFQVAQTFADMKKMF